MKQQTLKQAVAEAAISYIGNERIIGLGSGSTVDCFIDALSGIKGQLDGVVAASAASVSRLKQHGITVLTPRDVTSISIYVDGADEFNAHKYLIKGGGGALTREKILRAMSKTFICIVDNSKRVDVLGKFPVAIEVLPFARSYVARELVKLGATPQYRENFITDNGNQILDTFQLDLTDPVAMEQQLNNIVGIVENGLFAINPADRILIASDNGIEDLA